MDEVAALSAICLSHLGNSLGTMANSSFSVPPNSTKVKSDVFTAAGVLVVTLTITVTVLGDCLIFAAFFSSVGIRTRANLFFLSLITADILQAVLVMPLEMVRIIHDPEWPLSVAATKLWNSLFVCFGTASAYNLAAIGLERYLVISRPFEHSSGVISKKSLVAIAFIWLYAILSGIFSLSAWKTPQQDEDKSGFSISLSYAIPLLILDNLLPLGVCMVTYVLIFRISLEHSYRLGLLCGWSLDGHRIRIAKEKKSIRTLSLLVGTFTVCSLPFFIFHVVDMALSEELPNRLYASHVVKWLCYVNSACNWALYGFLNQEFRDVLFAVCSKCQLRILSIYGRLMNSNRVVPLS